MKRKLLSLLLCMVLILSTVGLVHAAEPRVIDDGDLLTYDEIEALEEKAQQIVDTYQMDVVILTVWSLDGKSSQDYADDYYDYNGCGIGPDYSGVLFLLSMEYRDWYMSTCGDAIYAITDYGVECIFSEMSSYLADGEYYEAFDAFLDALPEYFEAYQDGDPIDGYAGSYDGPGSYSPGENEETVYYDDTTLGDKIISALPLSLLIGVIAAAVTLVVLLGMMNTKKPQQSASVYLNRGSFDLRVCRDMFLYSRVSKTRRSDESSSGSSSRGGGSSTHRSSSGRSHGGGGGKF